MPGFYRARPTKHGLRWWIFPADRRTPNGTGKPTCPMAVSWRRATAFSCKSPETGFTSVVTQVARPHRLAHRTTGPGFWVEYRYNLRVCDDADPGYSSEDFGRGHLTITTEYGGWFGTIIATLRPGACRRYVVDEMDAIISAAESVVAEPVEDG